MNVVRYVLLLLSVVTLLGTGPELGLGQRSPSVVARRISVRPDSRVWLEGSRAVDGFTRSGNGYVLDGWTIEFDSSPTYDRGAPDGVARGERRARAAAEHEDVVLTIHTDVGDLDEGPAFRTPEEAVDHLVPIASDLDVHEPSMPLARRRG